MDDLESLWRKAPSSGDRPGIAAEVEAEIAKSQLPDEAKSRYRSLFKDRLRAIAQ